MKSVTIEQLHELFCDAATHCTSEVLLQSDDEIEHHLFEEFDVGVHSYFHDENLKKLVDAGMISKEVVLASQEIRKAWIELESMNWTLGEVKSHPRWKRLFSLCDGLLVHLGNRPDDPS